MEKEQGGLLTMDEKITLKEKELAGEPENTTKEAGPYGSGLKMTADRLREMGARTTEDLLSKFPDLAKKQDPWKHRGLGMKCSTCMWYLAKDSDAPVEIGRCRRHAPTMNGYPVVYPTDWCGDHKLNENSI